MRHHHPRAPHRWRSRGLEGTAIPRGAPSIKRLAADRPAVVHALGIPFLHHCSAQVSGEGKVKYDTAHRIPMAAQAVTTVRLDKETLHLLDRMAKELHTDRSSLIRRAVHQGARKLLVDEALARYQRGEISSGSATEAAGISFVELLDELRSRGMYFLTDEEGMLEELKELQSRMKDRGKRSR